MTGTDKVGLQPWTAVLFLNVETRQHGVANLNGSTPGTWRVMQIE